MLFLCVFSPVCKWTCMHMYAESRGQPWVSNLRYHLPWFLRQGPQGPHTLASRSLIMIDNLTRKLQESVCLYLPNAGITSVSPTSGLFFFYVGSKDRTWVFMFAR